MLVTWSSTLIQMQLIWSGFFHLLSTKPPPPPLKPNPKLNGSIQVECKTIWPVMGSAAEAETTTAHMNAQQAVPIRTMLIELGHPQPPTPLKTNNSTANGILNSNIKQKRSKAFDMRFHWLRDRIKQHQFQVYWQPGNQNYADYFSKHHPPVYHQLMQYKYLSKPSSPISTDVRGCVRTAIL